MKCPKCQSENADNRKFCGECGAKLSRKCPHCGADNLPADKFCGECGKSLSAPEKAPPIDLTLPHSYTPRHLAEKILTTRSSLEGERKLVTVLFADVANFTGVSEKLDPEEVHQIMDGCFKILMDEIHRYEGTINQFTGDGVMALFGAPVAHEDHAQRACYAGLSIQKAMSGYGGRVEKDKGVPFAMRIGINSGPVIVGAIGDDLRMDYTAVGDTTNLAARIQQSARAGEVWLSAHTQGLVSGFFEIEPVGTLPLKGKAEPQAAYRLTAERKGVRTRFEAGLKRGVSELVGRRPEMDILNTAWERVKSGEARVVDVVGEAGVGKSRLIYEFQKSIAGEAAILAGVCITYGRNINFLPIIDIVRAAFGIEEGMSEEEAGKRIREKAVNSLTPLIPFYCNLLSLKVEDPRFRALNPEGRKFGTFEAVKNLLLSISAEKPLVVFLEDVHWMDKISEEFFVFFSRSIHGKRVLMLTAYRPEASPDWAKGSHYRHLGLETLSEDTSKRLMRNILGGVELEPELERKIVSKTGGNPFFMEEMVRELLETDHIIRDGKRYVSRRPIDQLEIPDSVQAVLAARMDRLSEDLKRTMQVASVIGRDFAYKILRSIMELGDELRSHLANLVGIEVLYEKALYPELEYIFKHALTQEVAYDSLLKQRRREIHGRIAKTIEELYAGALEEHCEVLAHHWELSDNTNRAIEYLVLAGEKANRSLAASAAADFFTRALVLAEQSARPADEDVLLRIRMGRATPVHALGRIDQSLEDHEEAIRLARKKGDKKAVLSCLSGIAGLLWNTPLKDKVPEYIEQGIRLSEELGDLATRARLMTTEAYYKSVWKGVNPFPILHDALKVARESANPAAMLSVRAISALMERWTGRAYNALANGEGIVEIAQSMFNMGLAGVVAFMRGLSLTEAGRYGEAVRLQEKWIDFFDQNPNYLLAGRLCNSQGWTFSELYHLTKAYALNKRVLDEGRAFRKTTGTVYSASEMQAQAELNLIENEYDLGKIDDAWNHIARFEEATSHPDYDYARQRWSTRLKNLKGGMLLLKGEFDGAEELARECLETASKFGWKKYIGRAKRLSGRVFAARGACDRAEEELKAALAILEEVGNPKQRWITRTALAQLYGKMGRPDREQEQWQAAKAIVEATAAGLTDEQLRTTFLNAGPVREIMEGARP